jgi:hypothetical protein
MQNEEVLRINGSKNFNSYRGYGNHFELWKKDITPNDDLDRR